jgi:acyl carrier protein
LRNVKSDVINILVQESIIANDFEEEDLEKDLLANNILDSLNIVSLISTFEQKFDIEFMPDDIQAENWANINSIINVVSNNLNSNK